MTSEPPEGGLRRLTRALRFTVSAAPGWLSAHLVTTVAAATFPVVSVVLLKTVLDRIQAGNELVWPVAGLVLAGLGTAVIPLFGRYVRGQFDRQLSRTAQAALYVATDRLAGLRRLEDPRFRDHLHLAQLSGGSAPGAVVNSSVTVVSTCVTLGGFLAVLSAVNPGMAFVALLSVVPAMIAELTLSRSRSQTEWQLSPRQRKEFFYADLLTNLPAAKELRLLGLGSLFRKRMLSELSVIDSAARRLDGRELRIQLTLGALSAATAGAGLWWAVGAAVAGKLSIGDVSAFVAALAGLQAGLSTVVGGLVDAHHALLVYRHYLAIVDAEPDLPLAPDPRPLPRLRHSIEVRDVWFRYGENTDWVLRGMNLVLRHGTATALVGLNGAGKSTLVKLLCRFYDPDRGRILWDGVDIREFRPEDLRARLSVVFQDYVSYELTAGENIGVGDLALLADDAAIHSAAGRAGVDSMIEALPRGYRTLLSRSFADPEADADASHVSTGTDGVLLSGGQWQRIALARAYLRGDRDLLILDEPSSGLDALAEHEIHRSLRTYRTGATSVLISHRLGTVRDADHIVVLADGHIVEQGTHDSLRTGGGVYARLFQLQAEGYRGALP
ncbi:ABC transporter ATP-binding protein [Amycolatopsis sp. QT-25]|uniref:ABC transporter ATP-binding protein n=1 Tax=Amycolatopsis sp. QT-25 TaxID=3034022 RepID=UPI0023EBF310|nr:ABC transporter ATP-binding protein [Amycolatopsis sp. QT-25]WET76525.1 ABC transporter ATP-binding protein [Amycolatopsis sp. QT-25]